MGSSLQLRVLEALEGAENYNRWLADLTLPYLGDDPVEVGSGIGVSASLWLEAGLPRITVTDTDDDALERLQARFADDRRVRVESLDLSASREAAYSAFVALNVLEHIADHEQALRHAAQLVRPGGRIVVFVPAFSFAAGRFDRLIGHHRRYTVRSASDAMTAAGLELDTVRYVNAPGLLAWFLAVRVLRLTPSEGPLLRVWDRAAIPVIRRVEGWRSPPFGQSVLAVGRRPGDAS
jgi:SAM-dependent methyltransferase